MAKLAEAKSSNEAGKRYASAIKDHGGKTKKDSKYRKEACAVYEQSLKAIKKGK